MPTIVTVPASTGWTLKMSPSATKFNSEITNRMNILISNQITMNDYLVALLPGSVAGSGQSRLLFATTVAPTGWTRESVATDSVMAVTSGAGRLSGGSWTISSLSGTSSGSHSHDMQSHTHDITHSHPLPTHSHTMNHSHTTTHSHTINSTAETLGNANATSDGIAGTGGSGVTLSLASHTHSFTHTHTMTGTADNIFGTLSASTTTASPTVTSYSGSSTVGSSNTTSAATDHSHSIFQDGSWRPKYLNLMVCSKD